MDLIGLWMIGVKVEECKYERMLAIYEVIFNRDSQESGARLVLLWMC